MRIFDHKTLIKQIDIAVSRAYAPYSKFNVGALIVDENGQNHSGCNVENAAYPSGCCAEQSAVSNMIINGGTTIKDIYIKSSSDMACPPCGNCRQIISEFSNADTKIHMLDGNNEIKTCTLDQLLPAQFNADWLENK